jgi:cytochrome c oxidase assembly protein subunit 15
MRAAVNRDDEFIANHTSNAFERGARSASRSLCGGHLIDYLIQMRRLTRFQRLALWTTATTYLLILVGGLVRASGAGLGCPDWPRCFGSWVPPLSAADLPPQFDRAQFNQALMWTEYLNRLLGVTVGLLIFATLVVAIRDHRCTPRIVLPTMLAFLLVGFEGWLGGVVVQQDLAAWIVTAHLIVALIIVSLLLYATVFAFFLNAESTGVRGPGRGRRRDLAWTSFILIVVTLVQVALGTQVRERVDEALSSGVARTDALATVGAFDRWHRDASLVVFGLVLVVMLQIWNSRSPLEHRAAGPIERTAYVMAALVVGQLALGITLAYLRLTPSAQIAHLSAASLLLGAETVLFLLARWLP